MNGEFRCCQVDVPIALTKPTEFWFVGDVHSGAPGAHMSLYRRLMKEAASRNAYLFLMGDMFEMFSYSERAHLRKKLHESTDIILNDLVLKQVRSLAKDMEPVRGRILGSVEGNHHSEMMDGRTSTQVLCDSLGAPHLGTMALIRLNLQGKHGECIPMTVCIHHGTGVSQQNPLLAVKKLELVATADIYVMGHDHSLATEKQARLQPHFNNKTGEANVKERPVLFGRSGSFLRAYMNRQSSYVVNRALKPSALGCFVVEVTARRVKENGKRNIVTEFKAVI